ncbi:MAG: CAP domain-containing protein [Bacteroidota bacterium]
MKKLLSVSVFFLLSLVFAQAQMTHLEKQQLSRALLKRINDHRLEMGHLKLIPNDNLAKAAEVQCDYLRKAGKLSHDHPDTEFRTPKKRVNKFDQSFVAVGENVLYSKPTNLPLNKISVNKLAFDMFRSWKNSPGHYANIISNVFDHSDFAFGYNTKTKRVYAVHVFGKLGHKIPNQLSENAFGIIKADAECNQLLGGKQNILVNMGNSISIEGDEVVFRYHNKHSVMRAMDHEDDGIAIDLVVKDQMDCGRANRLDASEIYDGVLLKPIYRDAFFAKNTASGDYRIIVSLGKVPEQLLGKELSPNMIFIKWGMKCNYVTPTTVPSGTYALKKIKPILYTPNVKLKTEGIKNVVEMLFDFNSGSEIASNAPELSADMEELFALDIQSHTSVDGNVENNRDLHLRRAKFIKDYVADKVDISKATVTIDAGENWDLLDYQLERLELDEIRKLPKPKIRAFVNKESNGRLFYSLEEQRRSSAVLYTKGVWTEKDENHIYSNLLNGLVLENMPLANRALVEMYKDSTNTFFLEENFIMDRLFHKKELVQNVSALILKNINAYSLKNIVFFVRTWLSRAEQLSKEAQKNLLNLYTITGRRMLFKWDLSAFNLKSIMHPKKVEPLFASYKSSDVVNPLFLNFHMTRIRFYGQINEYEKTGESFDFITDYYRQQSLTIEDDIALSLFFNNWSAYYNTNELLFKSYNDDKLNEQSAFILAQTVTAYPYHKSQDALKQSLILALHRKAISFNKIRWCSWMDLDFQNLRNDSIKSLYCNTCKN